MYFALQKCYPTREQYGDTLLFCRHCSTLFWKVSPRGEGRGAACTSARRQARAHGELSVPVSQQDGLLSTVPWGSDPSSEEWTFGHCFPGWQPSRATGRVGHVRGEAAQVCGPLGSPEQRLLLASGSPKPWA